MISARSAFRFVLGVGIVNLFADLTYEGARSVGGPFLASLGAGAATIGFVAGFGELAGYGLRVISGLFTERTRRYWPVAFAGYALNLLSVPALALAGSWPAAAALIATERAGRGVRKPAMEAMISSAGETLGHGWVFGLNEALDQTGATAGPLIVAGLLARSGGYRLGFCWLLGPALLCLGALAAACLSGGKDFAPPPSNAAISPAPAPHRGYWLFVAAGALVAFGFADFALIAFHLQTAGVVRPVLVPVLYAAAMASGAVGAPFLGKAFDRFGLPVLLAAVGIAALSAPFVFFGGPKAALWGIVLWGLGGTAQSGLFKAGLAHLVPAGRRASRFGAFDGLFAVGWFMGSAAMGLLYSRSIAALVVLSVITQLAALPLFWLSGGGFRGPRSAA